MAQIGNYWLLVDDDATDAFLFLRVCARAFDNPPLIHREIDGRAAIEFLEAAGEKPCVIISDLKMPRMDGLELAEWVHLKRELTGVDFVLLTSSESERHRARAKALGVETYLVKPPTQAAVSKLKR